MAPTATHRPATGSDRTHGIPVAADRKRQQTRRMVIALLAVLGVDLLAIVVLLGLVIARKRWVRRQPGAFTAAIRTVQGEVPGLASKWRRGYGRWVRDVLVWERKPFLFRNLFVSADALTGPVRDAAPGEVKRLGKEVAIVPLLAEGGALIEIAVRTQDRERAAGPFSSPGSGSAAS